MEKWEIRPRSPKKNPEPIVTKICTGDYVMQNCITIQLPLFVPQICENAHKMTAFVLPTAYSQDPCTDVYDQYVK